jgi:hypothetical protein
VRHLRPPEPRIVVLGPSDDTPVGQSMSVNVIALIA